MNYLEKETENRPLSPREGMAMQDTGFIKRQNITAAIAIAAAIITLIIEVMNGRFMAGTSDIVIILLSILMIAAFKRPSMPCASVLAGVGGFSTGVYVVIRISELIAWALSPSVISPETADGIKIGAYCCGFVYSVYAAYRCVNLILEMRIEEDDDRFQSTAASRDIDGMIRFMVNYLRPDHTGFIMMIAGALLAGGVFIILTLSEQGRGTDDIWIFIGIAVLVCILAGIMIWSRRDYQSYVRRISDSGEISGMAKEFIEGTRYWDNGIVLGERYIFARNSRAVYKYSEIAKIYQKWSDINTLHHSPWWHLNIVTVDGRDLFLVSIPYFRTEENFIDKVLPVILEIRSRNPQVVIG